MYTSLHSHTHTHSFPFDEQYRTITAMSAARAPVKRQTAVGLFENYR